MTDPIERIRAEIARRNAAGLGLFVLGDPNHPDGFTITAKDTEQKARWTAAYQRKGFTVRDAR